MFLGEFIASAKTGSIIGLKASFDFDVHHFNNECNFL